MKLAFADTSYFIAIVAPDDGKHDAARKWSQQPLELVTTAWVMVEVGAYLRQPPNRELFTRILASVRATPRYVPASIELFDRGAELYAQRPDKEWSLVDCTSFVVMRDLGITDALSCDHHFEQAGFKALLA